MPKAMPGYELDFVLPERRLEQITAFTNKVTEDGARTHVVNSDGSARHAAWSHLPAFLGGGSPPGA